MLRWRLIVGTLLIAGLLALGWLDWWLPMPGMILVPLALVFVMLASGEFLSLVAAMGYAPRRANVYGGNLLIVALGAVPCFHPFSESEFASLAWLLGGFALALFWAIASEIVHYDKSGRATANLAMTVFAYAYLGLLFGFMTQLRAFDGSHVGMVAFMSLVVVTKSADMGAYFAGRLFGRHKLIPAVSPGKTVEGLIGGAALATFASWLVFEKLMPMMVTPTTVRPMWGWIAFGLGLTLAGLAGDLIESVLKRDAGRKDSSTWMPGLGGVLDVVDSLLVAAPMAYGFWLLGFVGP